MVVLPLLLHNPACLALACCGNRSAGGICFRAEDTDTAKLVLNQRPSRARDSKDDMRDTLPRRIARLEDASALEVCFLNLIA